MQSIYSSKKVTGFFLGLFLVMGIVAVSSSTAQAQYGYPQYPGGYGRDRDYRRDDRYGRNGSYDVARERGYSYGLNVGSSDSQHRRSFDPQRSHYFKDAADGYRYGDRREYQQFFRQAFVQGYREGYQRYGYNRGRGNGRYNNGGYNNGRWWPW
jgi:hypothetical protein